MQCPSCQHENPAAANFCQECGNALTLAACASCGAQLPESARFCHECGAEQRAGGAAPAPGEREPREYTPKHLVEKILQSKSALEGERKQVTVLFADVKGSLELAEQVDVEAWHRILERFFEILTDGVHRFEGTVNQYTGDGIMALFGAPIAHEDHAQRACYAALHLQDVLRAYANQLRVDRGLGFAVRLGLNSGEVVVGKIGDDLRMDYTAQGLSVGLAARMQQIAEPGRTYLTGATAELVSGYFELEDLGASQVQGVREPVPVFALRGIGEMRTRLDLSRARGFSRFVGREPEMTRLEAALERALEGDGRAVGIVAEAGMGKSRLCHEFTERCHGQGVLVRHATGVPHGKAIPLLPILEFFRDYFGIRPTDGEREARQKIAGAAVLLDADLQEELPLLFDILGVPDAEHPLPPLDAETRRRRAVEIVKRFTVARSRREPSVLIFEDLHWIDSATEIFVEAIADSCEGTRTLVLFNFRPEYRADWMHRSYYEQLALRPLDGRDVDELLSEWLGDDSSLAGVADRVFRHAAGNPFFVEEIVRSLIESGQLSGGRGDYRLLAELREIALPATVQSVLAARIDRLAERDKRVLQAASVIGNDFAASLLAEVAELPEADLAEALRSLVKGELLLEQALYPEPEYGFRHPLTRDVAYDSQLQARREAGHAAVARALAERHAESLDEKAALLAHHWELAGQALEASRWHQRAADWIARNDPAGAVEHWQRVRALLAQVPESPEVLELHLGALASLLFSGGRMGVQDAELEEIEREGRQLLERTEESKSRVQFLMNVGFRYTWRGRTRESLEIFEEVTRLADATGAAALRARVRSATSFSTSFVGPIQRMLQAAEEALEILREAGLAEDDPSPQNTYAETLGLRGFALGLAGRAREAARDFDRAVELATPRGDLTTRYLAGCFRVWSASGRAAIRRALPHAEQAAELALQVGSAGGRVVTSAALARARCANGDFEGARSALEGLGDITWNLGSVRPFYLAAWADTELGEGDVAGARARASEAVSIARDRGLHLTEELSLLTQARVLREVGDAAALEEADAALERAAELIELTGAHLHRADLHEERGELAGLRGDGAAREPELAEAERLRREMGFSS